jgi:single stranded DNA-binding protein
MDDINIVVMTGRLGQDAVFTKVNDKSGWVKFSIANNQSIKNRDTDKWEKVGTWFNITGWVPQFVANMLTKGTKVAIEGQLIEEKWSDRSSGEERKMVKVKLTKPPQVYKESKDGQVSSSNEEDIPF